MKEKGRVWVRTWIGCKLWCNRRCAQKYTLYSLQVSQIRRVHYRVYSIQYTLEQFYNFVQRLQIDVSGTQTQRIDRTIDWLFQFQWIIKNDWFKLKKSSNCFLIQSIVRVLEFIVLYMVFSYKKFNCLVFWQVLFIYHFIIVFFRSFR